MPRGKALNAILGLASCPYMGCLDYYGAIYVIARRQASVATLEPRTTLLRFPKLLSRFAVLSCTWRLIIAILHII